MENPKTNGPAPLIDGNVLKEAQINLDNYINYNKFPEFTKEEQIALLYNADILHEANLEFLLK
ncbi:MAG: hypothetical protein MJ250_06500 [Alphaproteobacteria bacterium]|nr:hypothetical protein [Alphaproteobacteria bacterium]